MLIATSEGTKMELISAGMHTAVCTGLVDLGLQKTTFSGVEKVTRKVLIMWELPDETYTDKEGKELPRSMSKTYTLSLNDRSSLFQMLTAWRNKPFTATELAGFDLRCIVGKGCQLSVAHEQGSNGNTYANIKAIVGLPKGMTAPTPTSKIIFDLDEPDALDVMAVLPDWVQNRIKESETYHTMVANADKPAWDGEDDLGAPSDDDEPFK